MGIETLHPEVLRKLNKNFTFEEVRCAAAYLSALDIDMRAFLLLNPPFLLHETENETWILKSHEILSELGLDRKSTRLNSSHVAISYAVFCLKKKTTQCTPLSASA